MRVLEVDEATLRKELFEKEGEVVFEGTVYDRYYEFEGGDARTRLGDWPRVRHKRHKDGREEWEFTMKGERTMAEGGGSVVDEQTIPARSLEDAENIMRAYLHKAYSLSDAESQTLYAFNEIEKGKTVIRKEIVIKTKRGNVIDEVIVDIYTMRYQKIVVRDGTNEESVECRYDDSSSDTYIPAYAEFEVVYADPKESASARAHASALVSARNRLIDDLGLTVSSLPGTLSAILKHYGLPTTDEQVLTLKEQLQQKKKK